MIEALAVGQLYSNEEVHQALQVSNAGGIRLSLAGAVVRRIVLMTSEPGLHGTGENPYHDRIEGDILTFAAAGKFGPQTLAGANNRLIEQKKHSFPIHGFALVAGRRDRSVGPRRWRYLGLLEYLRHYPDTQLDAQGKVRRVWLFEFKIHDSPQLLPLSLETSIAGQVFSASRQAASDICDDDVVDEGERDRTQDIERIEYVRGRLLSMEPRNFEFFIKELLVHCGFSSVCVTKFSADGGVDVNARAGARSWIFEDTLVQVQAKRWLHSVGRREVAELRGSLHPFAKGAVVTTSHFSRAAINEANEEGKSPIALVDGFGLSKVVLDEGFGLDAWLMPASSSKADL